MASDRVRHEPLMQCLSDIGVDGKDIKIIRNLYWQQTASVWIMNELSDEINEVGKQFRMKINNTKKTKAMAVSKKPNSPKINIVIELRWTTD